METDESAEKVKSGFKSADRPHGWTIGVSLLAAAIGLCSATFSWQSLNETRENRRINEETSRAYLRLTSLLLDSSLFSDGDRGNGVLTGFATITNTGRVAGKDITTLLDMDPPRGARRFAIARFEELPPGSSNTLRFILPVGHSKSLEVLSTKEYVLAITVEYIDGVSRERRAAESTFCMPMDKLKVKEMVSLYPCDVHFAGSDDLGNTPP